MILKNFRNNTIDGTAGRTYDLIVVSAGYETRARYLCENFRISADEKLCLNFKSSESVYDHALNFEFYQKNKFKIITVGSDSYVELKEFLFKFAEKNRKNKLNVLVDYSSMSRVWYAYILSFFDKAELNVDEVVLTFAYSHSQFEEPPAIQAYQSLITPIEGYYAILPPIKPTALILGLGYIKFQAFGLAEYFEAEPYAFINRMSDDDQYYISVINNNKLLIENIDKTNIFYYSIYNLEYSYNLLNSLCRDLQISKRIVLAPCGPKPFTLICLITSIQVGNIDVWRISASNNNIPVNKVPNGLFSIVDINFNSISNKSFAKNDEQVLIPI